MDESQGQAGELTKEERERSKRAVVALNDEAALARRLRANPCIRLLVSYLESGGPAAADYAKARFPETRALVVLKELKIIQSQSDPLPDFPLE